MLTVHDHTFDVRWHGWGALTPYAEKVAMGVMLRVLAMSPEEVRRLGTSKHQQGIMIGGARNAMKKILVSKGKVVPYSGVIELEAFACPKV
jgi:hypothetical protein